MATASKPVWTQAHQDALDAMRTMKVPEKEARKLLEVLPATEAGELMRQAFRARSGGAPVRQPVVVPGGPQNAVPINRAATPPPLPQQLPKNMPPLPGAQAAAPPSGQKRGDAIGNLIQFMVGTGMGAKGLPKAPISPAAAQVQAPPAQAPQAVPEKPRIRVRAAGGPVPPAPIGGQGASTQAHPPTKEAQPPSAAQQTPSKLPRIRSEEELANVLPGTEFVWIPDGHIYRKNE